MCRERICLLSIGLLLASCGPTTTSNTNAIMALPVSVACGVPSYDRSAAPGLYLYRDCDDVWHLRAVGGGKSALVFAGTLSTSGPFSSVKGFRIESNDTLTTTETAATFRLNVYGSGQDGIDFALSATDAVILRLSEPYPGSVFVGANKALVSAPLTATDALSNDGASPGDGGVPPDYDDAAAGTDAGADGGPDDGEEELINGIAGGNNGNPNGNVDPSFVPQPNDYIYVDLNAATNGDGRSAASPRNLLPRTIGSRTQLLFNSDGPPHRLPCGDNTLMIAGHDIRISSYGNGRATVSAYEIVRDGWTRIGSSNVWRRKHVRVQSPSGPIVGNVVNVASTQDSPNGDVLAWRNLEAAGNKVSIFHDAPEQLPLNHYAFDWRDSEQVIYVNIGANPNGRGVGIACVGHFVNSTVTSTNARVAIHNLRIEGFAHAAINLRGASTDWHIYNNILYGIGGRYNSSAGWYHGSGVQLTDNARRIEINNNRIIDTYDSPITPQYFGGTTGGQIQELQIHHNFIDRWALGAIEIADWSATGGRFSRITIEDNTAIRGGEGFAGLGDSPLGFTDAVHVRGNNACQIEGLTIRHNTFDAADANIRITTGDFADAIRIEENSLTDSTIGVHNTQATAVLRVVDNRMCTNGTDIINANTGSDVHGNGCF